ncbi:MAG: pilin [Proteobacteria bacterium]|nr:pilin [Pseudomonadota bacterium]
MLEIVIVLGILALLAAMAVPSMANTIVRNQIVEAVPLVDFVKTAIGAIWAKNTAMPSDNATAGVPPADKIISNYVSAVNVKDGAIDITFGNQAHTLIRGKVLTLRPAVVPGYPTVPLSWVCAGAAVPAGMSVLGSDATTVPLRMLPFNCK